MAVGEGTVSFLEGVAPGRLAMLLWIRSILTGIWAAQSELSGLFLKGGHKIGSRELIGRS